MQSDHLLNENKRLQTCIRDLVSVMALPAMWAGRESFQIADSLLDSVLAILDLDFAYLHLGGARGNAPRDTTRLSHWASMAVTGQRFEELIEPWVCAEAQELPQWLTIGGLHLPVSLVRLGLAGEFGMLLVGSRRADFPRQTEGLLLSVAANQATIGFQAALQLSEQKRVAQELDQRVDTATRELAEANEELRRRERDFQLVVDTIPAIVWSADADGQANFVNQRFRKYVGLSTEEARAWGWTKAVHPDDLPSLQRNWHAVLASGCPGEFQTRVRRFDGEYRWFLLRAEPLADTDGNLKWFVACVDVHDWKQAQDELRDTQAELAHVTRVTTMGQLTASIAHELNQPLAGIMTNASTCLRMLSAEQPNIVGAQETARRTIRDANRATEVIARLRALFKKQDSVTEAVDLNTATQEVIALASRELQAARVNLCMKLSDGLPSVNGDRIQLQQVIMNLILNAVQAMGSITDRAKDLVVATDIDAGGLVRISVQDTGVGVDPTAIEKLFQPFYTTKSQGMGIGLSVSRSIIENHQGRLWAEPNDGPGATFLVAIPALSSTALAGQS